jgi:uncharacterized phage protein (TIGR01671 family)
MREILCRGIQTYHGKFVYGYYRLIGDDIHVIIDNGGQEKVHPETVGQFTGLNDKNGVPIYEDDILRDIKGHIFKTFYNSAHCAYMTEDIQGEKKKRRGFGRLGSYSSLLIEVIGNIHDNPELLKGKAA